MKKFLCVPTLFLFACGGGNATLTLTIDVIGDPAAINATNGADQFLITLDDGFLVYRNIDLVSDELDEDVALIAPGEELNFVANQAFNITLEVPQVNYQQVRAGLDDGAAVAFSATGQISINGDAPVLFQVEFPLPAQDENLFDNAIAAGNEINDTISFDLDFLFSNIDYVTIEDDLNGEVVINEANLVEISVQDAFNAYTAFFGIDNNDTMYSD
jgi:hypothetical protein